MSAWTDFKRGLPVFLRKEALPVAKGVMGYFVSGLFVAWLVVAALWVAHGSSAPTWEAVLGVLFFIALFVVIVMLFIQHVVGLGKGQP